MLKLEVEDLQIGHRTFIHPTATIRGSKGKAKKVILGDNVYIGENVQILVDDFEIGDYSKIHHHTNIHGYKACKIGHNAWIGQYTIIDSIGGMTIGNNCGIGAHSQLWSHIKYGDTLEGCRFLSEKPMVIGDDVWFVGHCIVSPIKASNKSMGLVGSVITSDMAYNNIYGGSPAKNLSDKMGTQFQETSTDSKWEKLNAILANSVFKNEKIKIVRDCKEFNWDDDISYFEVTNRSYTKKRSDSEIEFMKYLLPEKAKFIPARRI